MRPSARRRAAAWLLALPLGRGGEECARRGRLEMISFWLLCWKLLRATAGLRRTTPELTDGNHDDGSSGNNDNSPADGPPTPPQPEDPVTMEISASQPQLDPDRENSFSCHGQEEDEHYYPETPDAHLSIREEEEKREVGKIDGDECDYLVFEIGLKKDEEEGEDTLRWQEDGGRAEDQGENRASAETEGRSRRGDTGGEDVPSNLFFKCGGPSSLDADALLPPEEREVTGHDLGARDDLSDGHLSDCLQAELAVVYSDSDAGEDQWAGFAQCDVISQEETAIRNCDGGGDGRGREEEEEGNRSEEVAEVESGIMERREEEVEVRKMSRDAEEEQLKSSQDLFPRSPSVSSTASSTDPDRRVPGDFCVLQDSQSENVSSEHVDFMVARQQWKKMEEQARGQPIPTPGLRTQGSFQGTHISLYPPTRSPRLKHSSEDSGLDDSLYRSPPDESESAVEREIRLTLEREEQHRRESGMIAQGLSIPRPCSLQTGRSPPRPPACRTPTLSISPSPSCSSSLPRSLYHEMTANNVIILEPDSSSGAKSRLLATAIGGLTDWPASLDAMPSDNVIVVETSNLIIRSASEFCLNSAPLSTETQESTFTSNPFFKLRSLSSQSLVEQEIRMVRQREEEWRKQREQTWRRRRREEECRKGRERYDTVLVSPGLSDSISFSVPDVPDRCVSSPSSPSRMRKMERSSLSCDHKFPASLSSVPRRQNAMAQWWEASLQANQKKE